MIARNQGISGATWRRLLFDLQSFVGLNQAMDEPSKARVLVGAFVESVESGKPPDQRISIYIVQALSRLTASPNGRVALVHCLGLDGSISGMTKAAAILHHFRETVHRGDQPDQAISLRIAEAVRLAAKSGKGVLAKQLGIQRMQAGNPGRASKKRRLTPGDREEIPMRFSERLRAEATRPGERGAKSARTRVIEALATEYNVSVRTIENCLKVADDEFQQRQAILNPRQ